MNNDVQIQNVLQQMRQLSAEAGQPAGPVGQAEGEGPNFGDMLKASVDKVNETQQAAGNLADAFSRGEDGVELTEVMLALQKADVSFQAMSEVRNRLVEAYQEIMRMQI
ncbi:flagellar hook-basal body complex protein FliE [Natronospira proteinivora]|uniref:Flagellar hook-basal body complex protein FliE n=1 Tax=Natronospira proteinivora TaxID=1807133 RepID=A0ABT1G579_9GAMM|nr:flagellar hook-basal body complex protein FliE [Natronospira proteinivora]MCP1726435.1 flagellar hook-basal body complex protein FliE [Natronospira proteinivora]